MDELATFCGLIPLLEVDLRRPWQDVLLATDASVDFGFGVSAANLSPSCVRKVGRVAERPSHMIRLTRDGGADDEPERPRKRTGVTLPLSKSAFATVISAPRTYAGHSSHLEAHGTVLGLKWLLRSTRRHGKCTVVLVDAQAIVGAATKGRSSAACIARHIAHIGALAMAGDLLVKCVYIPSEDNPADAPSRGVVHRWRSHRTAVPAKARKSIVVGIVRKPKRVRPPTPLPQWRRDLDAKAYRLKHFGTREERGIARRLLEHHCHSDDGESISSIFSA